MILTKEAKLPIPTLIPMREPVPTPVQGRARKRNATADAEKIKPVYESLPGWKQDLTAVRRWEDLPENAIGYLQKIEKVIGTEIGMVGVGPDREQSIIRPGSRLEKRLQR